MELGAWSKENGFTPLENVTDFNRVRKISNSLTGFTLIEVMTAVVVMAIIMIPIALIALEQVRSAGRSDIVAIASNLAQKELGFVNTLSYTSPLIADGYDSTSANYAGYKYDVKRTVNYVSGTGNNLKRVRIRVYPNGSSEQLAEVDTFAMAVTFGAGSGGGASDSESASFQASGGSLSKRDLTGVGLRNTRANGNITLISVKMSCTTNNKNLQDITIDGQSRFSGSVTLSMDQSNPTSILLQKTFIMNSNTQLPYPTADFSFNNTNRTHTIYIDFVFYDNSQTTPGLYHWTYTK